MKYRDRYETWLTTDIPAKVLAGPRRNTSAPSVSGTGCLASKQGGFSARDNALNILYEVSDMPIRRHRQVKTTSNPFEPSYEAYFEVRLGAAMLESIKGYGRLQHLWRTQGRRSPIYHLSITAETSWQLRHIVRKVNGGLDNPLESGHATSGMSSYSRVRCFSFFKPALMWSYQKA